MFGKNIFRFIFVIILQIFVLNQVQISGYINPYFYIIFILLLPVKTPAWLNLILAFLLGFIIDIFSQSPGLHTSASVAIAFLRPCIMYSLKSSGELDKDLEPNISNMGAKWFISYAVLMIIIHHSIYFFLEVFSFQSILNTIYRILLSSFATFVTIILAQLLTYKKSQK